jgi:peptidoglycan/xylan/chitin deacetylase (PgdA/CDA1 family)
MAKEILCGFGVDVDAVAGWLGSYGGEDSPDDISRGLFAGEVGAPRLITLFERWGIKTTWFIPGHSGSRQVHRAHHRAARPAADRLRGAMVGVQSGNQRAATQEGDQIRSQLNAPRFPALLRSARG